MAHFAEIDRDNKVIRVIVVSDSDTKNSSGVEDEAVGHVFCNKLLGGNWKQTSYNSRTRKHYAGIGFVYDEKRDAFIPSNPYLSWILNDDCNWDAPIKEPMDGKKYHWDEKSLTWLVSG